jgi:APA family basic amino acid/polyamine antiporter
MQANKVISVEVATAVGLGAIIGAGIFVLSGTAIALAGSAALIAFIIVGIIALIVAFELGELGSIMPYA